MRYGYEFISFAELSDTRFDYLGISYPQPNTTTTTKIIADGSNIFAARSNGEILKGDRPIWDKEFSFPTPQSVSLLSTSQAIEGKTVEWTPEGLRVQGVSVRI